MSNGSDWLPPGASEPRQEKQKKVEFLGYGLGQWITAAVIGVVILVWFAGRQPDPPHERTSTSQLSVAEKLALIDRNTGRESDYNRLLNSLMSKCGEARIDVSDTAVRGTQVMKQKRNVTMSALEFLAAMDGAIPEGAENINCSEIAAALITLTGQK